MDETSLNKSEIIKVTFPDGSVREYPKGVTIFDVAKSIGPRLAKATVAGRISDHLVDLDYPIDGDVSLILVTEDSEDGFEIYRHTAAHIMAQAVKRLKPDVKLAIGPAIEDGFYYDFDIEEGLSSSDLTDIEAEMANIINEDLPIERVEMTKDDAIKFFEDMGEDYKVELINGFLDKNVSFYRQGEFIDLCRGPHLQSTKRLKAFKLLNVAGAYWRGDSKRPMLQRIYGTAFPKKAELDAYLNMLEEAAKRDHRVIGRSLDLFSIQEEGPGFPFFHPRGMVIRNELEAFWRAEHIKEGYQEIKTPIILNRGLWENSGHWEKYRENMYFTVIDEEDYAIKPMNCPGAILLYKRKLHSYRELPIRIGELGLVHRHELSGTLHGLMRVRCFTQDDAHIFMTPSQIKSEIQKVIDLVDRFYNIFGFEYHVELSTRPENAIGSYEVWEQATTALKEAVEEKGMDYIINEGDGAFYGPKLDFHLKDCIGRTWQCGTIQLDFIMPERFDLSYIGDDGEKHRPVMIHRVIFGSIERFVAILTEHFAGAFPLWLAPVQARIIPVSAVNADYAKDVERRLANAGIRVESDLRNEKLGYKVREAQLEKVPYMLVVGDKEAESDEVSIRGRAKGDLGRVTVEQFIENALEEIQQKAVITC